MFVIIGCVVVVVAVVGGYLLEHGNIHVLFQPVEVLIIFGAAAGALLISSPGPIFKAIVRTFPKIFSYKGASKEEYMDLLVLLFKLFQKMRKEGLISVEEEIDNPQKSKIFSAHPQVMKNHHAMNFICDSIRIVITSNMPGHELETILERDIEILHHEALLPAHSIARIADSLPGLGIVAAVLGVIITMGKIDQPPTVLGHSIGVALVGTFLGVLACYGFVGPMAATMEHMARDEKEYLEVIKAALVAYVDGAAPQVAIEIGRRTVPGDFRPSFSELEEYLKAAK
ncbi:MAG: flagellar motor stator protein MotA [Syntrophobacterales bacterium]|nr:flagellar motor stator protein MotA [Syntrophobacterales bacterium]